MPKIITPGYEQLVNQVNDALRTCLIQCKFVFKGKGYRLTSLALERRIKHECAALMNKVELTEGELALLKDDAPGKQPTAVMRRLVNLIVATIDLKEAKGDLPSKDNVTTKGLIGLFFNAMLYTPNVEIARITRAVAEADQDLNSLEIATLDRLLPLRAKDVARCIHTAMATEMQLDQIQELLSILRTQYAHLVTQQLRVECGLHGLRAPVAFISSFVSSKQVATGNTQTWQDTVLAIVTIAREKYAAAIVATRDIDGRSEREQAQQALATSCEQLVVMLEQTVPTQKDEAFTVSWANEKAAFRTLLASLSLRPSLPGLTYSKQD